MSRKIFIINVWYLIFNSSKRRSSSQVSNTRYFSFNITDLSTMISFVTIPLVSISFTFWNSSLYLVFLITLFLLHHSAHLNQSEQVSIYQCLGHLFYFLNCLNRLILSLIYQYLIYQLLIISAVYYKVAKSAVLAKSDVSTSVAPYKSDFVA